MTTEIKAIKNEKNRTLITGEARIAFPHLFEPHKFEGSEGEGSYSAILMIPKTSKCGTMPALGQMVKEALKEKFGDRLPSSWINPLRDGDAEADKYPERAGHWVFKASSKKQAPIVVDRNKAEIMDARQIYSGCYVRAEVTAYGYNNVSRGVNVGLRLVQKLRDGEPLGAPRASAADLPDLEPDATAGETFAGDDADPFGGY